MIRKLWYALTGLIPRRIPETEADWEWLLGVLHEVFGIPQEPRYLITIAGHLTGRAPFSVHFKLTHLVNQCRRLATNDLAGKYRALALKSLQDQLAGAMKKVEAVQDEQAGQEQQEAHGAPAEVPIQGDPAQAQG